MVKLRDKGNNDTNYKYGYSESLNFSAELNWGGIIYFYILKLTIIEITMIDRLLLCII